MVLPERLTTSILNWKVEIWCVYYVQYVTLCLVVWTVLLISIGQHACTVHPQATRKLPSIILHNMVYCTLPLYSQDKVMRHFGRSRNHMVQDQIIQPRLDNKTDAVHVRAKSQTQQHGKTFSRLSRESELMIEYVRQGRMACMTGKVWWWAKDEEWCALSSQNHPCMCVF
jgi:hypothetical protein